MKLLLWFRYILFHDKKTPNDAVTPQRQSQFTPKMKAIAVPRLLSSLVWIDQYNECHGMTSFMEFIKSEHYNNEDISRLIKLFIPNRWQSIAHFATSITFMFFPTTFNKFLPFLALQEGGK